MKKLTVVYLTFRRFPRFEWFVTSLLRELRLTPGIDASALQVVAIDARLWYDKGRKSELLDAAAGRLEFEHYPPKPSVWQGPSRQTSKDYFCAANARNTAFAYTASPHVVFVDDLSVLLPGWLKMHLAAASGGYALCGTTCKHKNMEVSPDGDIVRYDEFPPGTDSRLKNLPAGDVLTKCPGGQVYGGTFSVPIGAALRVNGQDEINDTIGGEDYEFGIRLERLGTAIYISRGCGTFEDEDGHHTEAAMVRLDKPWPPKVVLPGALEVPREVLDGPYASNYLLNRLLRESDRTRTIGNPFNLFELRTRILAGEPFSVSTEPTVHWVDGQPLSEM